MADRTTPTVRVGTSGWQYDDWDGAFYPDEVPKTRWFDHYAREFSTVEINASFYRLPTDNSIRRWHDQAPDRFRYAAKGSRFITHNLKIGGDRLPEAVDNVMGQLVGLKTYLEAVLWQLPPNLHVDAERLEAFLSMLPSSHTRHAVEFRHPSWHTPEVFDCLDRHGAAHVWVSSTDMPADRTLTGGWCYVRFHGLGAEAYRYDYAEEELRPWAEAVREAGCDALVYFNNDYDANAIGNARTFLGLLGDAAYAWP